MAGSHVMMLNDPQNYPVAQISNVPVHTYVYIATYIYYKTAMLSYDIVLHRQTTFLNHWPIVDIERIMEK